MNSPALLNPAVTVKIRRSKVYQIIALTPPPAPAATPASPTGGGSGNRLHKSDTGFEPDPMLTGHWATYILPYIQQGK